MNKKLLLLFLMAAGMVFAFAGCAPKETSRRPVEDVDGNRYTSVVIGGQEWLRENLKTTRYQDGTLIANVTDAEQWVSTDAPAYAWYDNDSSKKETFAALYNWRAVGSRDDLCPCGWRVATDEDWKTLEAYLGMEASQIEGTGMRGAAEGAKLKQTGTQLWDSPNEGATDAFGFAAVPSGRRTDKGVFLGLNRGGTIWTGTDTSPASAYYRHFTSRSTLIGRNPAGVKIMGLAVRCIKDNDMKTGTAAGRNPEPPKSGATGGR